MVTREEIVEQFENYGMEIEDNVISKCLRLCEDHQIKSAVLLMEHWLAFSLSNFGGAQPNVQTLTEMEKKFDIAVQYSLGNHRTGVIENSTPQLPLKNSEKVLCTFGKANLVKEMKWSSYRMQNIIVKQKLDEKFGPSTKYMLDNINGKCQLLKLRLLAMGKEFWKKIYGENNSNYNWHKVDVPNQGSIKTMGRIASDCDAKLTYGSTVLVGSDQTVYRTAHLNFNKIDSFAVFPGQIVMVAGKNPRGDTIYVEEIMSEGLLELPVAPNLTNPINFVISAGPYTCESDLTYGPLEDLLHYCKKNTPDVVIMCGPFIDADHPLIVKNTMVEPTDVFLEKILHKFADALSCQTTVCVVPSAKDVISTSVYPTCPFTLQTSPKNVHLLSDPSLLDINGVIIGITSIDVLNHIKQEELSSKAGDKLKRCVSHLFQQKSFYPLNPAPMNSNVDGELLQEFGQLNTIPNIIVLPSDLKFFIREVHNCLAINPGRITNRNGGTFARLTVNPSNGSDKLTEFVVCQILKV